MSSLHGVSSGWLCSTCTTGMEFTVSSLSSGGIGCVCECVGRMFEHVGVWGCLSVCLCGCLSVLVCVGEGRCV